MKPYLQKTFKKQYKQLLNQEGMQETEIWLQKIKETYSHTYPHLVELANLYNEKKGITKQFV